MWPARWADADAAIVCGTLLLCHLIGVSERGCQHVDSNGRWCTVKFETAKAISAAINVLNDYTDSVTTVDKQKFWGTRQPNPTICS